MFKFDLTLRLLIWLTQDITMIETINPYRPIASEKINTRTMPTKMSSVYANARTPASPATPIASPEANALPPVHSPAKKN